MSVIEGCDHSLAVKQIKIYNKMYIKYDIEVDIELFGDLLRDIAVLYIHHLSFTPDSNVTPARALVNLHIEQRAKYTPFSV